MTAKPSRGWERKLKLIGAVIIICGCGYTGLKIAADYQKRADTLRMLQNGLNLLETEISYSLTPLPLALQRVGDKLNRETRVIFTRAAEIMQAKDGCAVSEAWEAGIKTLAGSVPVSAEEMSILEHFGKGLGKSAREEQIKNIALAREQLRMAEKNAIAALEKNKKMYQYTGFCFGLVIVLLLV